MFSVEIYGNFEKHAYGAELNFPQCFHLYGLTEFRDYLFPAFIAT